MAYDDPVKYKEGGDFHDLAEKCMQQLRFEPAYRAKGHRLHTQVSIYIAWNKQWLNLFITTN